MRAEVIRADSIDAAAERILDQLTEGTSTTRSSSRENVIYFDGWDGLGASAVLRAVAHRPAGGAPLNFDQVVHVDCSKWESRRALQRVIAEQLNLPAEAGRNIFYWLETLWSSRLPRVRCIWNLSTPSSIDNESFKWLGFVHVDLCPRLTHVLPLSAKLSLSRLETLEILWCGDLRAVFPDDAENSQDQLVKFLNLKRVHLHELPMLHGICGRWRMYTPNLESIKIRGCWSLTRLAAVGGGDYKNKVECDCEKEWWDKLKWEHKDHQSLYEPTHPRHYKKTLLRGFVLR